MVYSSLCSILIYIYIYCNYENPAMTYVYVCMTYFKCMLFNDNWNGFVSALCVSIYVGQMCKRWTAVHRYNERLVNSEIEPTTSILNDK